MSKLRHEILAEKLRVNRYFQVERTALLLFGFDVYSKERPFYRSWYTFSSVFCYILTMIGMLHYSYSNIGQIEKVCDALAPFIAGITTIWKFIILYWNCREIVELIHRIWVLTENANEADLRILSQKNKRARALSIAFCCNILSTFIAGMGTPIFFGTFMYIFKGEFIYKVVTTANYPIKLEKPLNYFIIYIWNVYATFGFTCAVLGIDTLCSWIAHNIAAQFQIVQQKMLSLSEHGKEIGSNDELGKKVIVECIKYHQRSIELADYFNRIAEAAFLAEISTSSMQVCMIAYQIGRGVEMDRALYMLIFMAAVFIQMSLYCLAGQILEDESEQVAVVTYDSIQWEHWSISNRKMLLLTILRAQRSCKISAVFFFVNKRTFLTVMQAASSYVTLLWSLKSSN